jgi:FMN-dependent NADH-azoreductase
MNTVLRIQASLFSEGGQSSRLADRFIEAYRTLNPLATVVTRDLARESIPHLTAQRFQAFIEKPENRADAQRAIVAESDRLIEELRNAETIVIGLPMYNFGIPSTLKAYFDHIARAGVTFRYTEKGPVGLLTGKKAYVFSTRGGLYAGTAKDTQTAYVRGFLAFLGIDDVEFVYAEGLAMGPERQKESLAQASEVIDRMTQTPRIPLAAAA